MIVKELREKRAKLLAEARAILDKAEAENRNLSKEETRNFNALCATVDRVAGEIEAAEGRGSQVLRTTDAPFSQVEADLAKSLGRKSALPGESVEYRGAEIWRDTAGREYRVIQPNESLSLCVRESTPGGVPVDELDVGRLLRALATGDWRQAQAERRAMGSAPGSSGGFLIPDILSAQLVDAARAAMVLVRGGMKTIPMETAETTIAIVEGDVVPTWKFESYDASESAPTFGAIILRSRTLAAYCVAPLELVMDGLNVEETVKGIMAEAMARTMDKAGLYGMAAAGEPSGLRSWPIQEVAAGGALTNFAKLSECIQKVREKNCDSRALSCILPPRVSGELDRLVDDVKQPLQMPKSVSELLLLETTSMPVTGGVGENEAELFVGDFRQLACGLRLGVELHVSREAGEVFRKAQVAFLALARLDYAALRPDWFTVLTGITPPA